MDRGPSDDSERLHSHRTENHFDRSRIKGSENHFSRPLATAKNIQHVNRLASYPKHVPHCFVAHYGEAAVVRARSKSCAIWGAANTGAMYAVVQLVTHRLGRPNLHFSMSNISVPLPLHPSLETRQGKQCPYPFSF
ncbi:unnamed protein product [Toxocara canis]|uniref:Uncharacterized protein n=1 Tax=Toxocara canis TaxID=6265 RepID=A0A183UNH6_TOXCA|nr:unnamed protein product [Toxocara canis]